MQDGWRKKCCNRKENICREDEKQGGAAVFCDRNLFIRPAFAADRIYLSAVYENGPVQFLQYEIYWTEKICRAG